jgi:hypothetical protein
MDPVTTRALAKATEATAKAAGQGLEIVHDTGGYLKSVFGDLIVNGVGWLIGDWVGQKRLRNFDALCRRTLEIQHERDVKAPIELSPNQAMDLLTGAQDESRPELAELWARLLANAMDPRLNNVRHSFIEAVKNMDPPDAMLLEFLYRNRHTDVIMVGEGSSASPITHIKLVAGAMGVHEDVVEASLRHLETLSFLDGVNQTWSVNVVCREFLQACYPELSKSERT